MFERPPVIPFVECPNCKQLLKLGTQICRHCREEINPSYAVASAIVVHHNTQACTVANTISSFNAFIPLALIGSAFVYVADFYSYGQLRTFSTIFLWPLAPLLAILVWYVRFGRFKLGDEEYLNAKREMRRSFTFWLAFLIVQILVTAVSWR